MIIEGVIKKIYADKTGWAAVIVEDDNHQIYHAAGRICGPAVGSRIKMTATEEHDPNYGLQYKVSDSKVIPDDTPNGLITYLSSGFIKGIGPKRAEAIIKRFGSATADIIVSQPDRLTEISGITDERAAAISEAFKQNREYLRIYDLLGNATAYQVKTIYEKYGTDSVDKLKEDPYRLIYDLNGFGFIKADKIAKDMGIVDNDPRRISAAVVCVIKTEADDGHCYVNVNDIDSKLKLLISDVDTKTLASIIKNLVVEEKLMLEDNRLYLKPLFDAENEVAETAVRLLSSANNDIPDIRIRRAIADIEKESGIKLADNQVEAISKSPVNRLSVITGGPGTGKTTIIKGIIKAWGQNVLLTAPTGRAAKRMESLTGVPAQTIHRLLLRYSISKADYSGKNFLVITDEASMIDITLAARLMHFVDETHASLLLIGDIYQLPPIGPGNFFRDMVTSPCVPTVTLSHCFRQSGKGAKIAVNAKTINEGIGMHGFVYDDSFRFIETNKEDIVSVIIDEYKKLISEYPLSEICCITPIRKDSKNGKRVTSSDSLNLVLRDVINPYKPGMPVFNTFRLGDRVMQTENDAHRWVMNGDCGIVTNIDSENNIMTVHLDDDRDVEYTSADAQSLVLAYAITVHKAQGSEYKAVILIQCVEHYIMLQRSLLYTGVTRASEKLVLIGNVKAINTAVRTVPNLTRNTQLRQKIGKGIANI